MKNYLILVMALVFAGCTPKEATAVSQQQLQAQLDVIARECRLGDKFRLRALSGGQATIDYIGAPDPSPNPNFDCALNRATKIPGVSFGFIGNEAYEPNK